MLYNELFERLDRAITQINAVKSKIAKRDLIKMVRGVDSKMTAVDQERVECRRPLCHFLKSPRIIPIE